MHRQAIIALMILAAIGGWIVFKDLAPNLMVLNGDEATRTVSLADTARGTPVRKPGTIHIATFQLTRFRREDASRQKLVDTVIDIIGRFEIVALQAVRSHELVAILVDQLNTDDRNYDYVLGPPTGSAQHENVHFAFLFDQDVVQVDREQLYVVRDPDDLLRSDPLVAWFRTVGPSDQEAFTFSLVNVDIDLNRKDDELDFLDDVLREVRKDGRNEDDVIVLGGVGGGANDLGAISQIEGVTFATYDLPTNTQATGQFDNLIFHRTVTDEFTGRAGVFDFMRQYNFSLQEALEISDRMPVWAEFSIYEGGRPSRVAQRAVQAAVER